MKLRVEVIAHNSEAYQETVCLRDKILRKPLNLNFTAGELADESNSSHVACYANGRLVGCLVLKPREAGNLQMRQVAVSQEVQGLGVGRALVDFSEQYALEKGYTRMFLHARQTAVGFYLKLGYEIEGEPFEEVTILHRSMFKNLVASV